MPKLNNRRVRRLLKSRQAMVATVVVALVAVLVVLELTSVTNFFGESKTPAIIPVAPTSDTNDSSSSPSPAQNNTPKPSAQKDKETTTPSGDDSTNSNLPLYSPYGQFVSNHTPGASGSPSTVDSVCITTPGAQCYIKFTKSDGTTSQLPSQTTGSDGSTRWSWDSNILSSGDWTVTAVATLAEQTKTTQDPTPLSII